MDGMPQSHNARVVPARFRDVGQFALAFLAARVPSDKASIMLVHGAELEIVAGRGHPENVIGMRLRQGSGPAWDVIRTRAPVRLSGIKHGMIFRYCRTSRSLLVPILDGDTPLGLLNMSRRAGEFSDDEVWFIGQMAESLARILLLTEYVGLAARTGCTSVSALLGLLEMKSPDLANSGDNIAAFCLDTLVNLGLHELALPVEQAAKLGFLAACFLPAGERKRVLARLDYVVAVWLLSSELLAVLGVDEAVYELVRRSARFSALNEGEHTACSPIATASRALASGVLAVVGNGCMRAA